jgi:alpha-amylase
MVTFHNAAGDNFFVTDWWSNDNNQIAFGRGDAGFIVINREEIDLSQTFQTSMAPGLYCDVISGGISADGQECSGGLVSVEENGRASLTVPAMNAVAIHWLSRLDDSAAPEGTVLVTFQVEVETIPGENIFLVGSVDALVIWDPDSAVPLSSDNYPLWQAQVELPAATTIEYKYIRKDETGTITWESDPNRTLTTPFTSESQITDQWR